MKKYRFEYLLVALLGMNALPSLAQDVKENGSVTQEKNTPSVSASDVQPEDTSGNTALVRIDRFQVKGNTLLDPALIERLLNPFKGENRSYTDIQLALEASKAHTAAPVTARYTSLPRSRKLPMAP